MNFRELKKKLIKNGWEEGETNGSHVMFRKNNKKIPVPFHGSHDLAKGTLHKIFKETGLK